MTKKVFITSLIVTIISIIGIIVCYLSLNHKVDLAGILSVSFIGYFFICLFVPSAVLALIFGFLHFYLPDYFYLNWKKRKQ